MGERERGEREGERERERVSANNLCRYCLFADNHVEE